MDSATSKRRGIATEARAQGREGFPMDGIGFAKPDEELSPDGDRSNDAQSRDEGSDHIGGGKQGPRSIRRHGEGKGS